MRSIIERAGRSCSCYSGNGYTYHNYQIDYHKYAEYETYGAEYLTDFRFAGELSALSQEFLDLLLVHDREDKTYDAELR